MSEFKGWRCNQSISLFFIVLHSRFLDRAKKKKDNQSLLLRPVGSEETPMRYPSERIDNFFGRVRFRFHPQKNTRLSRGKKSNQSYWRVPSSRLLKRIIVGLLPRLSGRDLVGRGDWMVGHRVCNGGFQWKYRSIWGN